MRTKCTLMIVALIFVAVGFSTAKAQGGPPLPGKVIIGDLQTPRGIAFDANGNLIITVVGNGGAEKTKQMGPEGETELQIGLTGKIVVVNKDGKATDWASGFPSYASPHETTGLYRADPKGGSLWVLFSGTGAAATGAFWADSIVEYDIKTLVVKRVINMNQFEAANDPDGNGYDSNVSDIAWGKDGTMYITNAGANALYSWTEKDGLKVIQAWKDNAVPTSVEVAENGDLYVGFLGAGIAPMAGKIEHWSAAGKLVETFSGLTAVTDILLDGDKLYAVQLFLFNDKGPGPGSVVLVDAKSATPVAEGIPSPFALAKGPDGKLYVSFGTVAFAPGMTGGVVRLDK